MFKFKFIMIFIFMLFLSVTILCCDPTNDSGDGGDSGDSGDGGNSGEPTVLWSQEYDDGGEEDIAYGISYDSTDNAIYVAGYNHVSGVLDLGWKIMKLDADNGNELWTKYFDGVELGPDSSRAITHDSTGVYVVGAIFAAPKPNGSGSDMSIKKLDSSNGNLLWEENYDSGNNEDGYAYAVTVDPNNGIVYMAGYQYTDSNTYDDWWIKAVDSSDGSELWEIFVDAGGSGLIDRAYGIKHDSSDNSVYVSGYGLSNGNIDTIVKKLDGSNNGAELWSINLGEPNGNFGHAVDIDSQNVYVSGILLGDSGDSGIAYYDVIVNAFSKTDGSGVWSKRIDGTLKYDDYSWGVAVDESRNAVYSVGYTNDRSPDSQLLADLWINKLDSNTGEFYNDNWNEGLMLDGSSGVKDCARAVTVGDDSIFIAGYSNLGYSNADWWVISIEK